MRKSEYYFIRNLVIKAKDKYFLDEKDAGDAWLSAIENYCDENINEGGQ